MTTTDQQTKQEDQTQQKRHGEPSTPTAGTTDPAAFFPHLIPYHSRPKSLPLGALLDMQIPIREHLVMPWLRQKESAMIYAAPGVGKSLFAVSLALAVAGGGNALGIWDAPRAQKVLYIDGEMPLDDIQARVKMLLPSAGGDIEAIRKNLHFQARQHQPYGSIFTDLSTESGRETLLYQTKKAGVELLILDNLSTLATVEDENAASQFNDVVKFLLRMKQEGIACVLVHHSNKTGASYRGSSKLATTFEVIVRLEEVNLKSTDQTDTTRFRLSWDKFRGKKEEGAGVPLDFALEQVLFDSPEESLKVGDLRWVCGRAEDTRLEELVELIRTGEFKNQKELASAFGVSTGAMTTWKAKTITLGYITAEEWAEYLPGTTGRKSGGEGNIKCDESVDSADY